MCHASCIAFGNRSLTRRDIAGKSVLEVGSCDVNGSLRPYIESLNPKKYVGIDISSGPGVDVVCRAEDMLKKFGHNSFDVVVSTELLEHVRHWRLVVSNMKNVCKPGGLILITTRSPGFVFHGYPNDFWRYEQADIRKIFGDCKLLVLERDPEAPGVFAKIQKPRKFTEKFMTGHELYSIVSGKRAKDILDGDFRSLRYMRLVFVDKLRGLGMTLRKKIRPGKVKSVS